MNIERLLAPISEQQPCGENLEYDAEFMALEQARAGKTEQQFGTTIIPAEAPDWRQIEQQAQALMMRTKDIRVILILTEAWTHLNGIEGFAGGIRLLTLLIENYWLSLFPALEFDGEPDPLLRINALANLGDGSPLTATLRQAKLFKSASGEISLREASALLDGSKTECSGYPGGLNRLQQELTQSEHPSLLALDALEQNLLRLSGLVTGYLGESSLPDMSSILKTLGALLHIYRQHLKQSEALAISPSPADEVPASAEAMSSQTIDWRQAQLTSKADAQLMLEKVKLYFRQYEPSHPAPIMLERVERLIELDFLDIIRELAPDAVNQLKNVLGRTES